MAQALTPALSQKGEGEILSLCLRVFVVNGVERPCCLLGRHIAGGPNAQLLTTIKLYVFAALAENTGGSDARANSRSYGRADSATCDSPDERANAGRGADLLHVTSCRVGSLHSTFRIDLACALATVANNFNYLGTHL
jgi:hypothetical protein